MNYIPSDKTLLENLSFVFQHKVEVFIVQTIHCKGIHIVITEKNGATFKCPFNCVMSGNSGSGKTH